MSLIHRFVARRAQMAPPWASNGVAQSAANHVWQLATAQSSNSGEGQVQNAVKRLFKESADITSSFLHQYLDDFH